LQKRHFGAQKAGFDDVEINAASSHYFIIFLHLSGTNAQDSYGGSQKTERVSLEKHTGIKKLCGKDFPGKLLINA